jgi:hydrogenase-4 component B
LLSWIVFGLFGLALIGGLAMLCFTKAFGSIFLGTPRYHLNHKPTEATIGKLIPMYAVVVLIIAIGLFPKIFIAAFSNTIFLFTGRKFLPNHFPASYALSMIGICAAAFILLSGLIYFIRRRSIRNKPVEFNSTWSCGYVGSTEKMQYTASSFVRAYRKLAEPILSIHKKKKDIEGVFPDKGLQETHPYDKSEEWFIDYPLRLLKGFFNRFTFLQNGNLQFYILYGLVFITLVLIIPFAIEYIKTLFQFLNKL